MGTEAALALVVDPGKALAALQRFEGGIDSAARSVSNFAGRIKRDFDVIGNAAGVILKPVTMLVEGMAALKAATIAAGVASVGAAGQYEMFRRQLETVIKTREDATRAFEESKTFANATPFETEDIIRTRIELESVGVRGSKAVRDVAEAAAAMDRNILDVARAVKSMEVEPIRNLGIMMDELYSRGVDENFRKTTEGFRKAQEELLDIFEERFGGGVEKMALTYKGLVSTLRGEVTDLRATFGEGLLETSKLFVNDIITGIGEFKDTARAAGVEFGKELAAARVDLLAGFRVGLDIAKDIGAAMKADGIGAVILEALKAGARILGEGLFTAFEASISLWKVIGTTIGEGVLQAIYQSNIPGAGLAREYAIGRNLPTDKFELQKIAVQLGIPVTEAAIDAFRRDTMNDPRALLYGGREYHANQPDAVKTADQLHDEIVNRIAGLSVEEQAKWAQLSTVGAANVQAAIKSAGSTLEDGLKEVGAVALNEITKFDNAMRSRAGLPPRDLKGLFEGYREQIQQETEQYQQHVDSVLNGPGGTSGGSTRTGGMMRVYNSGDSVIEDLKAELGLVGKVVDERQRLMILREAGRDGQLAGGQTEEINRLVADLQRAEKYQNIGDAVGSSFARGFQDATMNARKFADVLDYIGDAAMNMADRIAEILVWEPMAQGISSGVSKMFKPSALGNAFVDGHLQAFGFGGIVDRPTYFGYSGGLGVAGEAGTEAIMPLRRTSSGRLGVEATGGSNAPSVSINVTNNSSSQIEAKASDVRFDGRRLLVGVIAQDRRNNGPISRGGRK